MRKYINYLKYVLEHKRNVFKICWKKKMYIHAFTHDISKFYPSEFFPYARHDFSSQEHDEEFEKAWDKHKQRNKHHWQHWVGRDMPEKYMEQMLCDWEAMSVKFGGSAKSYYEKNRYSIDLSNKSRFILESKLDVLRESDCLLSAATLHMKNISNKK
ncbi:MAG: DUF5662 family protein [Sarcina sp.]